MSKSTSPQTRTTASRPTHPFVILRQPDVNPEGRYPVSILPDGTEDKDTMGLVASYRTKKQAQSALAAYMRANDAPEGMSPECYGGYTIERRAYHAELWFPMEPELDR